MPCWSHRLSCDHQNVHTHPLLHHGVLKDWCPTMAPEPLQESSWETHCVSGVLCTCCRPLSCLFFYALFCTVLGPLGQDCDLQASTPCGKKISRSMTVWSTVLESAGRGIPGLFPGWLPGNFFLLSQYVLGADAVTLFLGLT